MAQLRFLAMPLVIWLISGGMVYWHHLSNTIYSHPIKSKGAARQTEQWNSANTLGYFSFKKQTFNKANIQNQCHLLIQRKSIQSHNKGLKWCLRLTELFKPSSLIAQSRARRQTQTKEDLEEQNGHKTQAHVPNKDSKVCLPIPCPPSSLGVPLMKRLSSREERRCVKDMGHNVYKDHF